ncbi:MAG TPA: hypothetical protein VGX76_16005 [Pirellulales bacterium]|nr:hypothetical protein [Pirellulales bacterium]
MLHVESLENRALPSANPFAAGGSTAPAAEFASHSHSSQSVIGSLSPSPTLSVSTIPSNGDLNPYGVAFVPNGFPKDGAAQPGDILVSNFNAASNLQGSGTTIDRITPNGEVSTFFQGNPGLGLTTALGVLRHGYVVVGNVPTTDGTGATAQPGSLLVLDKSGITVANFSNAALLDGPWDLTVNDKGDEAQVFVSNVLSGTVTRLDLRVPANGSAPVITSATQIASGYTHRTDPFALLLGPTGLAFDAKHDILYVASTADNAIFAIPRAGDRHHDAGTGSIVYRDNAHLHGPLALVLAPNGDLIVSNGDAVNQDTSHPSELTEFTPHGKFVAQFSIDPAIDGAFGIALTVRHGETIFAAVDDNNNMLDIWDLGH